VTDEGIGAVSIHQEALDDDTLGVLRAAGLAVGAFAVLEDAAIERVLRQGVSVFTTDRPDAALRLRAAMAHDPA